MQIQYTVIYFLFKFITYYIYYIIFLFFIKKYFL